MNTTAIPSSHPRSSPEMDAALQKYLLLSGQQDSLRRRLTMDASQHMPAVRLHSNSGMTSFFDASSPSPTPLSGASSPISPTTSAYPLPPVAFGPEQFAPSHTSAVCGEPDDIVSDNVLYDINQAIKATLTELLNRDEVKHDEHLRAWVQERLMDTQRELRRQRRRRSSASDHSHDSTPSFE